MTSRISFTVCACLFFLLASTLNAAPRLIPQAPKIAAKGWLLQDFHSGHIIAAANADTRMEPASLTKLMTAYAVFHEVKNGNISLKDEVTVSKKAWRMPGSRMFIEVNTKVSVEKLLKGMIIQSGNDASVALAEHTAGSEDAFASLMNRHAENIGMRGSHYVNATGLPHTEQYTTPHDIIVLTVALIREFPEYYTWYSEKQYTYNGITQYNRNKLLWRDQSVDGVKTGHTESAGFNLVTSAYQKNMRLVSVVMGTDSEEARARESQKLINYGFRFYETHLLYSHKEPVTEVRIWKGTVESLPLGVSEDLFVTVPRGQYKQLNASMDIDASITAPTLKDRQHGTLNITLGDKEIAKSPLVAMIGVGEGGIWQRMVDNVKLMFE